MRYFLVVGLLGFVVILSILGWRGRMSRKPPWEIIPDMKYQPKLRPQASAPFFPDHLSSRTNIAGTIPHGQAYADTPVHTGRRPGMTNFVETLPLPVTATLLAQGQQRYQTFCLPCHSPMGDGNGITTQYGMLKAANYHDPRLVRMPDGELFNTITYGKNLMASYASQVAIGDRWAIIGYIHVLQRSRLGIIDDVPVPLRSGLAK